MIRISFTIWVGLWIIIFLIIFIVLWLRSLPKLQGLPYIFKHEPKDKLIQCPYCFTVFSSDETCPQCPNCGSYL